MQGVAALLLLNSLLSFGPWWPTPGVLVQARLAPGLTGAGSVLGLGREGLGVRLHPSVQRGSLQSVRSQWTGAPPVPAGAAGQWLVRKASDVMSPHGLKPCAAP